MEWFKHRTCSHEDPDISDAWDNFGDAGPVVFWTIIEVFGKEFSHIKDEWLTLSIPYFERKLRRKWKNIEKILEFFEKRERIYFKKSERMVSITIPKFIKIASNWTARPKDKPTEAPTEVATEAPTAIEEEEEEKKKKKRIKKEKTVTASVTLPSEIDIEIWKDFVEMRKKKAPLTEKAKELILADLEKIGQDKNEVLKQSIKNSWRGVFELKEFNKPTRPVDTDDLIGQQLDRLQQEKQVLDKMQGVA